MAKKKKKPGRPTKYKESFLPIVIKHMSVGAAIQELPLYLHVERATINDWIDEKSPRFNKPFSDTIKRGVSLSEAWWMQKGRKSLNSRTFSPTLWYMNMKNRFGWRDKHEHHVTDEKKLSITVKHETEQGYNEAIREHLQCRT